ncbi:MAG TPA: hypothetical protein PK779_04530 [Niabella sp.]|nr:hypothetical protein [Niabella sp.]HQW16473.1 hypothetical protein [Niabella sp.]HQX21713.1 hypothetical protein [Niabella sp.]HQX40801.1 hypothetical protein [Niabella sp.]
MKKLLLYTILTIGLKQVQAQDIIYLKRNEQIKAKITEVMPDFVKYKKFDNIDGPNYSIATKRIDSIVYENGSRDIFGFKGKKISPKTMAEIDRYKNLPNNALSAGFDLTKFIDDLPLMGIDEDQTPNAGLYLSFERFIFKQKFSITATGFSSWNRTFNGVALSAKFYPKNTGKIRIGFGPFANYSEQMHTYYFYSNNSENWSPTFSMKSKTNVTSLGFSMSLLANVKRNIFLQSELLLGGIVDEKVNKNNLPEYMHSYDKFTDDPMIGLRLGLGYRF